jgi:dolichol-phosphate mannosyltransferase/undecaprenyl-phosphate 4-deoxy-4-formamido-L-arabinose transferase
MLFSIIVPVYNAQQTLAELCSRIKAVFTETLKHEFEIILVNDSSRDTSWGVMRRLHQEDNRIKIINLARNYGQHSAIYCGLQHFRGDYVILMDDDLQNPPEEIPKLIQAMASDTELDVVFGSYNSKKHNLVRRAGSQLIGRVGASIAKRDPRIKFTSFRIIKAKVARDMATIQVYRPRIGGLIMQCTNRIGTTPVEHHPRQYGKSGYSFSRLYRDFLSIIIGSSTLPLKLISTFGLIVAVLSMLSAVVLVIRHFIHGSSVAGWTSMMVAISFFSGFILFSLGIIGEYLIRILMEAKKNPVYFEREKFL